MKRWIWGRRMTIEFMAYWSTIAAVVVAAVIILKAFLDDYRRRRDRGEFCD